MTTSIVHSKLGCTAWRSALTRAGRRAVTTSILIFGVSILIFCRTGRGEGHQVTVRAAGDAGRLINAADARLGKSCGTIVVKPEVNTRVQTAVHLGICHDLEIRGPMTWSERLLLTGRNKVSGQGSRAVQTMEINGAWATAPAAIQVEVAGLWSTWKTVVGGDNGNRLLLCQGCSDVSVHDTHSIGGGYLKTDSLAGNYAAVGAANSSYRIHAARNFVDGVNGPAGAIQAAWYAYSWDVEDSGATVRNAGLAITWWGGNNNKDWTAYNPATLKAGRMHFSDGSAQNVIAAWWGCMGQHVVVERVTAHGCEDVCLDSEGDLDVVFASFRASAAVNGELSSFFHSQQIVFRDGFVEHTLGAKGDSFFNNNPTNDLTFSRNVSLNHVSFTCADKAICSISLDPIAHFVLKNSRLENTLIRNSRFAPEQGQMLLLSNTFVTTASATVPWTLVDLSTHGFGSSTVCDNKFFAETSLPPGSNIVSANNFYDNQSPGTILIAANEARGWVGGVAIRTERNETRGPVHVLLRNNRLGTIGIRQDANTILEPETAVPGQGTPAECLKPKP